MSNEATSKFLNPTAVALLFWVVVVLLIVIETKRPELVGGNEYSILVQKLVLNAVAAVWIYTDAVMRKWDYERAKWYAIFGALLTEITLPIYLVKSRGWKGAGVTVLRFVAYSFLAVVFIVFANRLL